MDKVDEMNPAWFFNPYFCVAIFPKKETQGKKILDCF